MPNNDAKTPITYADSGVDIDAGEAAVERIKGAAKRTMIPGVLGGIGGFGGLFSIKDAAPDLEDPVLVSGTDGVGTKLLVAIESGRHDTIGQDLVAMCVNDILTLGARPLFFLDYFATGKLHPDQMAEVVTSIARACEESGCALVGGETAELPGMYHQGHYDLGGFCVGVVDRSKIIDGTKTAAGDVVIGLASSGVHSNGLSLARRVIQDRMGLAIDAPVVDGATVADTLLTPTRLYVRSILHLLQTGVDVHAMAHITGGGIVGNLARAFPDGLAAEVDTATWTEPPIFAVIRQGGPVEEAEMRKTFNCGIGFAVVVAQEDEAKTLAELRERGEVAQTIGRVVERGTGAPVRYRGEDAVQ